MYKIEKFRKIINYTGMGVLLFLIFSFFLTYALCEQKTIVSIEDKDIPPNTQFTLEVMCSPIQSMKGWELSIEYPSNMLEVISITEGDIFEGYSTFFVNGTVTPEENTIKNIYNLIIGQGTVTEEGSLIIIIFETRNVIGTADINLINVGVCNESEYIPILIDNATINIYNGNPIVNIQSLTSNPLDINIGWLNVSFSVYDFPYVSSFLNINKPNTGWTQYPFETFINSSSILDTVGNYSYYVQVSDIYGNTNNSETIQLSVPPNYEIIIDGIINIKDYNEISNQYGETGTLGWIREDVDNNGVVNLYDIILSASKHNETWW